MQVIGPRPLRRALFTRISAWAAGGGWCTVHLDDRHGCMALAKEIVRAGAGQQSPLDAGTIARLELLCLGAADLDRALPIIEEIKPLDVLVLDGLDLPRIETHRLAHRKGTAMLLGRDHPWPEHEANTTWRLDRRPGGSDDLEPIDVAFVPTDASEPQRVRLRVPPSNLTPDLITRAGRINVFARRSRLGDRQP